MLPDSYLSMFYGTIENLLIKINALVWPDLDQEDIIETSMQTFMETRRKYKLHSSQKNVTDKCDDVVNNLGTW